MFQKKQSLLRALICFLALITTQYPAAAQECQIVPQATLALEYNGFVPTSLSTINDHPVEMGIDTGSQSTLVTPELVQRLHLQPDLAHHTQVFGTSGHQIVSNVLTDNLIFSGTSYQLSLPVVSLQLPTVGNSKAPDEKMEGLIGADILSHYDLDFDFPNKKLTLYKVANCAKVTPPWKSPYMTLPFFMTPSHRAAISIQLDGHPVTAVFDTGASGARLAPTSITQAGLGPTDLAADPLHDGAGVGGPAYKVPTHKFNHVIIGTQSYSNISIDIVDLGSNEADMLIGEDYMRPRRFWLSYATKTLYIQQPTGQ